MKMKTSILLILALAEAAVNAQVSNPQTNSPAEAERIAAELRRQVQSERESNRRTTCG